MPFFVYWPGVTKAGAVNQSVVQTTDIFPTLVEISGGNPSLYSDLDGISLLTTIQKNKKLRRKDPIYAYRAYQDLYVSVRKGPWKLLAYRSGQKYLYRVEEDRFEKKDLAEVKPGKVKKLVKELRAWEKTMKVEQYSGVQ